MQPAFRYVVFTLRPLLIAASDTMAVNIDKSVSGMFQTQEVKHVIPVAHGLERIEVPFQQRILRLRNGSQVGPIASGRPPFSTGLFRISISQRQIFAPAANKSRTYLPMRFEGSIRMMMQASILKQQQDICFLVGRPNLREYDNMPFPVSPCQWVPIGHRPPPKRYRPPNGS